MLDLRDQADGPAARGGFGRHEIGDFLHRHDLECAVIGLAFGPHGAQTLFRAQRLEFREGEILREPTFLSLAVDRFDRLARGKIGPRGNVAGLRDIILVPGDQHAVLRSDQVRLDIVGPVLDRLGIGGKRMFWAQRRCAAMGDQQRRTLATGRGGDRCPHIRRKCGGQAGTRLKQRTAGYRPVLHQ